MLGQRATVLLAIKPVLGMRRRKLLINQGFMFNVKSASETLPGNFFDGWFTYDAGEPNNNSTQHWLAISGTIPINAQAGISPVVIYRVLGGALVRKPTQNTSIWTKARLLLLAALAQFFAISLVTR